MGRCKEESASGTYESVLGGETKECYRFDNKSQRAEGSKQARLSEATRSSQAHHQSGSKGTHGGWTTAALGGGQVCFAGCGKEGEEGSEGVASAESLLPIGRNGLVELRQSLHIPVVGRFLYPVRYGREEDESGVADQF